MTKPLPCPPAPGPLEAYCARFDPLLSRLPQRRGFRDYLAGLLAPGERNKTLTALADVEPVVGASHPEAQRLQFFLSESVWDADAINEVRVRLLCADPATAPHPGGVLIIDDSGHPKDGTATAHVARQYLGGARQGRPRHRGGLQPVGRRAYLLAGRPGALHPGVPAARRRA